MDISDSDSKITTCSGSYLCTASYGGTSCAAAFPASKGGVVCSGNCPTIYTADVSKVEGTDGWNVWSESCNIRGFTVNADKTVKIKKSSLMSGELVIDRGSDTSGEHNRHFYVEGTLELEDITLTGGHAVSSFVFISIVVKYFLSVFSI